LPQTLDELPDTSVDINAELGNARISQGELGNCIPGHRELAEAENTNAELGNVDYSRAKLPNRDYPNCHYRDLVWPIFERNVEQRQAHQFRF
jgi:hypothetical protein